MLNKIITAILRGLIYAYRYSFSPLVGKQCRFQPTCSIYALEAIKRFGPWRGVILTARRLSSCHPWHVLGSREGYDPVPQKTPKP